MSLYLNQATGLVCYFGGHRKENINLPDYVRAQLVEIGWDHPANRTGKMPDTFTATQIQVGADDVLPQTEVVAAAVDPDNRIPVNKLVKIYVRIREAKGVKQKAFDAEIKTLDDQMKTIATELKQRAQTEGVNGFKTEHGTVYMATSLKTSCQDWGIFYDWIKANDALDFLERRISSGKVKDFMEAHDGELPPGVNIFKELEARVRKAGEK